MHQLAIALRKKGHQITGSDDEIFDPARGNLAREGLLPTSIGWNSDLITNNLDAVILGMHARENNPELLKAQELAIPIYSFPEYIYQNRICLSNRNPNIIKIFVFWIKSNKEILIFFKIRIIQITFYFNIFDISWAVMEGNIK